MTELKPMLRGYSHAAAAVVAAAGFAILLWRGAHGVTAVVTTSIYGVALVMLFAVSAAYHIGHWKPPVRRVFQSWDHANIFLFIAGSYTPIAFIGLSGGWRIGVLASVWFIALVGSATSWKSALFPHWVIALLYLSTGWVAIVALPRLAQSIGWSAISWMAVGGVIYTLGAVAYATRRPRLWPRVFGYHEVFHLAVIAASVVFYGVIAKYALPLYGN